MVNCWELTSELTSKWITFRSTQSNFTLSSLCPFAVLNQTSPNWQGSCLNTSRWCLQNLMINGWELTSELTSKWITFKNTQSNFTLSSLITFEGFKPTLPNLQGSSLNTSRWGLQNYMVNCWELTSELTSKWITFKNTQSNLTLISLISFEVFKQTSPNLQGCCLNTSRWCLQNYMVNCWELTSELTSKWITFRSTQSNFTLSSLLTYAVLNQTSPNWQGSCLNTSRWCLQNLMINGWELTSELTSKWITFKNTQSNFTLSSLITFEGFNQTLPNLQGSCLNTSRWGQQNYMVNCWELTSELTSKWITFKNTQSNLTLISLIYFEVFKQTSPNLQGCCLNTSRWGLQNYMVNCWDLTSELTSKWITFRSTQSNFTLSSLLTYAVLNQTLPNWQGSCLNTSRWCLQNLMINGWELTSELTSKWITFKNTQSNFTLISLITFEVFKQTLSNLQGSCLNTRRWRLQNYMENDLELTSELTSKWITFKNTESNFTLSSLITFEVLNQTLSNLQGTCRSTSRWCMQNYMENGWELTSELTSKWITFKVLNQTLPNNSEVAAIPGDGACKTTWKTVENWRLNWRLNE